MKIVTKYILRIVADTVDTADIIVLVVVDGTAGVDGAGVAGVLGFELSVAPRFWWSGWCWELLNGRWRRRIDPELGKTFPHTPRPDLVVARTMSLSRITCNDFISLVEILETHIEILKKKLCIPFIFGCIIILICFMFYFVALHLECKPSNHKLDTQHPPICSYRFHSRQLNNRSALVFSH
ncbi:hypothetical protein PUN28_019986 [Cardiocondyla obscurior]|uniref:Uncharacterized protein n=1 Tax=Cardiocondyla obscurior TaxID=286306 RepID=A0AAW2E8D7_9HYME